MDRRGTDLTLVGPRPLAVGRVEDELDIIVFQEIDQVRLTLGQLLHPLTSQSAGFQTVRGAVGRDQSETQLRQVAADL